MRLIDSFIIFFSGGVGCRGGGGGGGEGGGGEGRQERECELYKDVGKGAEEWVDESGKGRRKKDCLNK